LLNIERGLPVIYLMMSDQTYRQVPAAERALVIADRVVCFGVEGAVVATFAASSVTAFGQNSALKEPENAKCRSKPVG
jgi:hypothetical protein